ncbi:MAG: type II secretion system major pseudopilin GspG [Pirellulales bacterium]
MRRVKIQRRQRSQRRGFTLMEVLLVLVILVILGGIVGVAINSSRKRAFVNSALVQLKAFKGPLESYNLDIGSYPSSQQGLQALRQSPPDLANPAKWSGPYLDGDLEADPWGNPYQYEGAGTQYRIWSFGPNGVNEQGGGDDLAVVGE